MPTTHVNDINVYYELRGEGDPLVLLMGMTTDISEWESIIGPLAKHSQVLAFDNRGAGRTDKPDAPYSIEMMADDTAKLMQTLGIGQANILGISMGGRIALALSLQHPELVKRLILVSTAARVGKRPWWFGLAGLVSSFAFLSKYPQPRYAYLRQRQASSNYNCAARLHEIRIPTLILHGKNDKTTPYTLAEELHDGIPGSKIIAFEGGHLFMLMRVRERQQFLDAVAAFLAPDQPME